MAQNLTYTRCGDYLIPDIRLSYTSDKPLGKYGRMRRAYLEQNNPMLLDDLILTETLFPHLWKIDEIAHCRMERLTEKLLERNLSSSILGKISSANIFAHELSSAFFSRAVSENTLSLKDICWLLFTLNDINLTTLQIYNHYNTIDLGVVRLAAYSIFRNFLYF